MKEYSTRHKFAFIVGVGCKFLLVALFFIAKEAAG